MKSMNEREKIIYEKHENNKLEKFALQIHAVIRTMKEDCQGSGLKTTHRAWFHYTRPCASALEPSRTKQLTQLIED